MTDAKGICSVIGCDGSVKHRGMCYSHYKRVLRHGDPLAGRAPNGTPLVVRFWSYVDKSEGCWNWTGSKTSGYGNIRHEGRGLYAHRISYEFAHGPIPDGMVIDHICHNPACVNPAHLQAVTHRQNLENQRGAHPRNQTGIRGVHRAPRSEKFAVHVRSEGQLLYGGQFIDIKDAEAAAIALRNKVFTNNLADRK